MCFFSILLLPTIQHSISRLIKQVLTTSAFYSSPSRPELKKHRIRKTDLRLFTCNGRTTAGRPDCAKHTRPPGDKWTTTRPPQLSKQVERELSLLCFDGALSPQPHCAANCDREVTGRSAICGRRGEAGLPPKLYGVARLADCQNISERFMTVFRLETRNKNSCKG